ncbi:hypothetical protein [Candidatus Tisiphia endosymbiont of Ditula angustiorana]
MTTTNNRTNAIVAPKILTDHGNLKVTINSCYGYKFNHHRCHSRVGGNP